MHRFFSILILGLLVSFPSHAVEKLSSKIVDCSAKELKKAEDTFNRMVRTYVPGTAERYSGRSEGIRKMTVERQKILRNWLKVRCVCKPKHMSRFEGILCQAISDKPVAHEGAACLLQE